MLLMLRRSGLSFAQIGHRLGRTSRSVQSRYYWIEGIVFRSRKVHYRTQKIARAQAAKARDSARVAAGADWPNRYSIAWPAGWRAEKR